MNSSIPTVQYKRQSRHRMFQPRCWRNCKNKSDLNQSLKDKSILLPQIRFFIRGYPRFKPSVPFSCFFAFFRGQTFVSLRLRERICSSCLPVKSPLLCSMRSFVANSGGLRSRATHPACGGISRPVPSPGAALPDHRIFPATGAARTNPI